MPLYSSAPHTVFSDNNYQTLIRPPATDDGSPQVLPRQWSYGSVEAASHGLIPLADYPSLLVQPADFKEVIAYCHAQRIFPMYHLEDSGTMDAGWYQDGFGLCWAYGLVSSLIARRKGEGKPNVRLAPFSLARLVNYQNKGYYLDGTIAGARKYGVASAAFVPEYDLNPRNWQSGWEGDALQYRLGEAWDTQKTSDAYMLQQALSILRTGVPCYIAYDWWGHALMCCGLLWDESQPNNVIWLDWNSHKDGLIQLAGSRGVPDELYGLRSTLATGA